MNLRYVKIDGKKIMHIGGLQKTTLLDFPGKISAIVFTQGCNFQCPYCHNPYLVLCKQNPLSFTDLISFLTQRRNVLEGVVISGGEPTLHAELFNFCVTLKSLGYAVKLDTNGSRPDVLHLLLKANLVDYVAMDIKANPAGYPAEICSKEMGENISHSIDLLKESHVEHEFRIPCVAPFITVENFSDILQCIQRDEGKKQTRLFLQKIQLTNVLNPHFFTRTGHVLQDEDVVLLKKMADNAGLTCAIR